MKGLEAARRLYAEKGAAIIHEHFPEYEGRIAVGLAGSGSQCLGFDDEISRDHDFEPGFCLWLTDADDARIGIELARKMRGLFGTKSLPRGLLLWRSRVNIITRAALPTARTAPLCSL